MLTDELEQKIACVVSLKCDVWMLNCGVSELVALKINLTDGLKIELLDQCIGAGKILKRKATYARCTCVSTCT
jgi:hypothetical protein